MNTAHTCVLLSILSLSFAAQAQIYQYKDTDGTIIYSDIAPANQKTDALIIKTPIPANQYFHENSNQNDFNKIHKDISSKHQQHLKRQQQKTNIKKQRLKTIKNANQALKQAKIIQSGDILPNAHGGSRRTDQYKNRIQQAEQNLNNAKRGKRKHNAR